MDTGAAGDAGGSDGGVARGVAGHLLAFIVSNKKLNAGEKPLPKVLAGWALVRVRMAGICNTDVEILRGYHDFRGVPGHEFVGEVVEVRGVSAAVGKKWIGKRVTGEINIHCSAFGYKPVCEFCKRGLVTHCARRKVLGIVGQDGAFAEYLTLPIENLHAVPDGVSDEQAVFVEPVAAGKKINAGDPKVAEFVKNLEAKLGQSPLRLK